MAQASDLTIDNVTFPAFRTELNDKLAALFSQNSGTSAPDASVAYQWWVDTSTSPPVLKIRNAAGSWISVGTFDTVFAPAGLTPIANGGTGATTASAALTALLPSQTNNANKGLFSDGTTASWKYGSLFYRLGANVVGTNVTTAQSVFGVGVTLAAGTVYAFEGLYVLTKTTGVTSHNIGLGFGGTATVNNILHSGAVTFRADTVPTVDSNPETYVSAQAANAQILGATGAAALVVAVILRGTVSINTGGTFIPQYTLNVAPGGAYTTLAGSWISFAPIGAAGSNSSEGTWS